MKKYDLEYRDLINRSECGRSFIPHCHPSCTVNSCCCTCPGGTVGRFLSSYIEAVGDAQNIATGANVVFDIDPDALDIAGQGIEIDSSGTIFTITRAGLYHIEWSMNLSSGNNPAIIGLMENGYPASALTNSSAPGNHSSGALINVGENDLPYTISLHNFGAPISIANPPAALNTAVSIRILRFADGPS